MTIMIMRMRMMRVVRMMRMMVMVTAMVKNLRLTLWESVLTGCGGSGGL